jgi:large subunit ribosomal protein L7/L12
MVIMASDERAKLLEKKARIDARLKELALSEQKQKRRDDTRRKIIAGALVLEHATIKSDFAAELAGLLNRYVTRPEDRKLFDFLDDRTPDVTPAPSEGFAAVATPPEKPEDNTQMSESA